MKSPFRFLLVLHMAFFTLQLSFAQERGMKPVQVAIDGVPATLYAQSHALLIGVSAYNAGLPPLPGVVGDINTVKGALETGGFNVVTVMNPDHMGLQKAFTSFIAKYGQGAGNRLLIYYAGHGYTEKMPYGDDIGYICPVDAPDPNKNPAGFQEKAMPMRQIETYAYQIKSKHALFLFDACFSGSIFSTSRAIPEVISYKTKEAVRQFITSGSANETVPDKSIFKDQFVRALKGEADGNRDGYLTGTELGEFLQSTVVNYSYGSQHPQYGKIRNANLDKGDFVFVLKPASATTNTPVPTPSAVEERTLVESGKIEISTEIAGELYIDNTYIKHVSEQKVITINDLTPGDHIIKICGKDTIENKVFITANQTQKLVCKRPKMNRILPDLPEMVFIEGGVFKMGSNDGDPDEQPVHSVILESFYIGIFEVTVGQFAKFIEETKYITDSDRSKGGYVISDNGEWIKTTGVSWQSDGFGNLRDKAEYNHPVSNVSYNDAVQYCIWISNKTGKKYRLPTEAEWEYASRGGSHSLGYKWPGTSVESDLYQFSSFCDVRCNLPWKYKTQDDGFEFTAPVGSYLPNELGIFDMGGNVWEWCSDWSDIKYYSTSPEYNPTGPAEGVIKIIRGGSWSREPNVFRSTFRGRFTPNDMRGNGGFRVVMNAY